MPSTTPNFGFEYPLSSDALADGAQSIQDFATTADNTFVDLKGGTTGQYLTKTTNTDMDFTWTTLPTIPAARPNAGTGYYDGNKYQINWSSNAGTAIGTGGSAKGLYCPFFVGKSWSIDRIAIECTNAVASSTVRLGIYDSDGTGGAPKTLIADYGTVSTATTGTKELTISTTLTGGLKYLIAVPVSSSTTLALRALTNNASQMWTWQSALADALGTPDKWWIETGLSGALPATANPTLTNLGSTIIPTIALRAA